MKQYETEAPFSMGIEPFETVYGSAKYGAGITADRNRAQTNQTFFNALLAQFGTNPQIGLSQFGEKGPVQEKDGVTYSLYDLLSSPVEKKSVWEGSKPIGLPHLCESVGKVIVAAHSGPSERYADQIKHFTSIGYLAPTDWQEDMESIIEATSQGARDWMSARMGNTMTAPFAEKSSLYSLDHYKDTMLSLLQKAVKDEPLRGPQYNLPRRIKAASRRELEEILPDPVEGEPTDRFQAIFGDIPGSEPIFQALDKYCCQNAYQPIVDAIFDVAKRTNRPSSVISVANLALDEQYEGEALVEVMQSVRELMECDQIYALGQISKLRTHDVMATKGDYPDMSLNEFLARVTLPTLSEGSIHTDRKKA
jgi:hypothetical protein